jgi:PAS domain S-box-containing protein
MVNRQKLNKELRLAELLPYAVIITDLDFIVLYWSEGAEKLLGWKKKEAEDRPLSELLDVEEEELFKTSDVEGSRFFQRKDGSKINCEFKSVSYDDKRVFVLRDLTEQYERERHLESYHEFFERAQDMFFRIGKFEFNPKLVDVLGYSKNELAGISLSPLVHPDDVKKIQEEFFRVLKGETRSYEVRMVSKTGDVVWFEVVAWPWKSGGLTLGSEGILRDITKRKMDELSTKRLIERLEVLNSVLRHDLSNYLSVIGNYVELMEEEPKKEYVEKIQSMVKRALELIKDIKVVEDAERAGRVLKVINLSDVLINEIDAIDAPNAIIKADVPEDLHIWADEMVNSVISNILRNAIIHNDKEEKRIDLTARKVRESDIEWIDEEKVKEEIEWVEIRVADNGPGIPDDMKEEIFKEGVKDQTTGRTGLGLFLVKTLVMRYGGRIWVEDNEPEGSVFIIRFRSVENLYDS